MYTLDEDQIASAQSFIDSLPESIVKGNYERWIAGVKENGRITIEQFEKFASFANALPPEFQAYPQEFIHAVKKGETPETTYVEDDSEDEEEVVKKSSAKKTVKSKKVVGKSAKK